MTSFKRSNRRWVFVLVLFLLAFTARLIPVLVFRDLSIAMDMWQYDMLARSLASGNGYRWYTEADAEIFARTLAANGVRTQMPDNPRGILSSYRAPLFPFFLSLVYRLDVGAERIFNARVAQAALGALLPWLTYLLALKMGTSERGARIAGYIIAFYPLLVLYTLGLVTENLFIPLLGASLIALVAAKRSGRISHAILAGIFTGLLALTRSFSAIFWPLFIFWLWKTQPGRKQAARLAIAFMGMVLTITIPWSVRNSILHKQPVWLETSLGYVLYLGYHPTSTGVVKPETTYDLLYIQDDLARSNTGLQAALSFVRQDPQRALRQVGQRIATFWGLEWREFIVFYSNNFLGEWQVWQLVGILILLGLPLILLIFFAVYALVVNSVNYENLLLLGIIVETMALHALTLADPRYHLPLIPMLAILAGQGFAAGRQKRAIPKTLLGISPFVIIWILTLFQQWEKLETLLSPGGNLTYWGY